MNAAGQRGYILATVLVFLVVLSLTAFFGAKLARTDVQVVTHLQNEKDALFVAEAGVNEALYRLRISSPSCVTISGVGNGTVPGAWPNGTCASGTFDASLLSQNRGSSCSNPITPGSSPYGLDPCNVDSKVQVLFNTSGPAHGANATVPSLQPAAYALKYSTGASNFTTPQPADFRNLQIEWDKCTSGDVGTGIYGCTAAGTQVRRYPVPGCTEQRNIAKITSTGEIRRLDGSVVARRRVMARVADTGKKQKIFPSIITSLYGCTQGITMGGGAAVTTQGPIQVNAGAGQSATCNTSIEGGNNNSVTACTTTPNDVANCSISVSGANVRSGPSYSPLPIDKRSEPAVDPFNDPSDPAKILNPPSPFNPANGYGTLTAAQFQAANPTLLTSPSGCSGTYLNPRVCEISGTTSLDPGVYWGGILIKSADVTFKRGLYVLAGGLGSGTGGNPGGGMSLGNGGQTVTTETGGVTFYNTNDPYATNGWGSAGSFSLGTGNSTATLTASATHPTLIDGSATNLKDILLFQARELSSKPTVELSGGNSGSYVLGGFIYAWDAPANLKGHSNQSASISLIVGSLNLTGNSNVNLASPGVANGACSSTGYATIAWQDF